MYAPYDENTASTKDRIAWALCQIIDDDAPLRWTRYRYVVDCVAMNPKMMVDLRELSSNAAVAAELVGPLTFDDFRAVNVARCLKWHSAGIDSWSPSDWLTAVTGELGELASLLKMRNRERDGLPGNKFSPTQKQIADELADVLTYLDLLAEVLGVDLGHAAAEKFNEVSARVGFPDRIAVRPNTQVERLSAPEKAKMKNTEPEAMTVALEPDVGPEHPCYADGELDHEWQFVDESFDHEYGTERVHFWRCERCDATQEMQTGDYDDDY